jgi:hypothetical protein
MQECRLVCCDNIYLILHNYMLQAGVGDVRDPTVPNYFGRQNIGVVVSPSDVDWATVFVLTHKNGSGRHRAMARFDPRGVQCCTCKYTRVG